MVQLSPVQTHARAVNLARRWSEQNENDLVQDNLFEKEFTYRIDSPPSSPRERVETHARAVNLARRFTEQNENDLVMENMFGDSPVTKTKTMDTPPTSPAMSTHDRCKYISHHLVHASYLPTECKLFPDVVRHVQVREKDTTDMTSLLS